jgi:hypothetical protein
MFTLGLILGCLPTNAFALPVASSAKIVSAAYRADLEKVNNFLEEEIVVERLAKLGLSAEEVKASLGDLDEYQLHQVSQKLESLDKAGSGAGVALILVVILLIAVLFLYATDRKVKLHNPVTLEKNN